MKSNKTGNGLLVILRVLTLWWVVAHRGCDLAAAVRYFVSAARIAKGTLCPKTHSANMPPWRFCDAITARWFELLQNPPEEEEFYSVT